MFKREHLCEWREQAASLARALQQLRHNAAFEDPGTGVGNPPQLNRDFTKLLGRYSRYEEPFAVSLVELDHYLRMGPHWRCPELTDSVYQAAGAAVSLLSIQAS